MLPGGSLCPLIQIKSYVRDTLKRVPFPYSKNKQEHQIVHIRPGRTGFEKIIQSGKKGIGIVPPEEIIGVETQPSRPPVGLACYHCPSRVGGTVLTIRCKRDEHHV